MLERKQSMPNIYINARSSIRIEGTKVIYFDPFKITEEKHDADIVFVTHEHYDHFSPEDITKVSNENTILVVPYSMNQMLSKEVSNAVDEIKFVKAEDAGTNLLIDDILVKWVRAYNIDKPFHTKERDWVGYIVTLDGETYFVTGDTDGNEDNSDVKCDVLLVPCGGKYTFDAKEAAEFTYKIKPRKVIPTHYTDMPGESEIGEKFKQAVEKLMKDIEVEIML
jgi:L-ascorbate metabolism protein UlaG (beta-lactamase superfamily)